ncbi:glycine oxidase ThiO [Paenibacillus sp. TRM 82003]|nr:glycine oxidase ThiO [Paenibacillus sp. TRM 82003]
MSRSIVVVGGGVVGLSVAFECARRGHRVTVLERGISGGQASGAAAGMLAPYSENGEGADDFFRLCVESLRLYPAWQRDVKDASGADFEYDRPGSLNVVYHEADLSGLWNRKAWQEAYGSSPDIVEGEALRRLEPNLSSDAVAALYHPDEAHIYAPSYVAALAQACRSLGVALREHTGAIEIPSIAQGAARAVDASGTVYEADELVICSGAWAGDHGAALGVEIPVYPIRGQICAYELPNTGTVRHLVFGSQGYVVPKANGTLVCGASEDIAGFDTSVTERGVDRLLRWNRRLFPFLAELEPYHRWAGLRPATQDGYPLLGSLAHAPHIKLAAGHYRNGILLSPVTASVIADQIDGNRPSVSLERFRPERFTHSINR